MITHHLDIATLMSCAAGSQPEALAAVTVAHLEVCPTCSARLAGAQTIGEALFAALPPVALAHGMPTPAPPFAHLQGAPTLRTRLTGDVPLALVNVMGYTLADVQWDKVTTGVWTAPVPLSATRNGELHLLKLAPGVTQPSAKASGSKLSIVLSGSYVDGDHTFLPGDVADFDDQGQHRIAADGQTGCICLVAADR
jgi:putative transcriptional regulator